MPASFADAPMTSGSICVRCGLCCDRTFDNETKVKEADEPGRIIAEDKELVAAVRAIGLTAMTPAERGPVTERLRESLPGLKGLAGRETRK
jgi:hypothetical protein